MKPSDSRATTKDFKDAARKQLRASGKTIFLSIGDQIDDLDPTAKTGNFLLPNPFY